MKKALVLGLLAIFTVSYATAQNRTTEKKAEAKAEQKQTKKVVKPAAASFETSKQTTAGKEAQQPKKANAAAIKEKNDCQQTCTKQGNNAQGCEKNQSENAPKASTSKQKAEVGVPPTPKVKEAEKNTTKANKNNATR